MDRRGRDAKGRTWARRAAFHEQEALRFGHDKQSIQGHPLYRVHESIPQARWTLRYPPRTGLDLLPRPDCFV
eukprot:4780502-Pyramimonas_sp.AAC.1